MSLKLKKIEDIYSKPENAPWTYSEIPVEISNLIKNKIILPPGKVLEIGCGEGHQAIFLSKVGFNVTGIDRSENAIKFAKENAIKQNATANFKIEEYHQIESYKEKFDFVIDWRFLHEITEEDKREKYIHSVKKLLKPKGKYLSVSFSGDSDFMGTGTLRKSPAGIEIYFSTLNNLKKLIEKYLQILDSKIIMVPQKPNLSIKANYIFAQKP
jgi:cyclopropane fatty-acyl-phospholipid synthase-like methyltransferase